MRMSTFNFRRIIPKAKWSPHGTIWWPCINPILLYCVVAVIFFKKRRESIVVNTSTPCAKQYVFVCVYKTTTMPGLTESHQLVQLLFLEMPTMMHLNCFHWNCNIRHLQKQRVHSEPIRAILHIVPSIRHFPCKSHVASYSVPTSCTSNVKSVRYK